MTPSVYKRHAQAYARVGLETEVESASPVKLISLLFDGALAAIRRARMHLEHGNVQARGVAISKAIDIISNGLQAALNHEAGGELASRLDALYDYIQRCLLLANLHADAARLEEADKLLSNLAEAWSEMAVKQTA